MASEKRLKVGIIMCMEKERWMECAKEKGQENHTEQIYFARMAKKTTRITAYSHTHTPLYIYYIHKTIDTEQSK